MVCLHAYGHGDVLPCRSIIPDLTVRPDVETRRRILLFALFPALFAAQQVVEGLLWLNLEGSAPGLPRGVLVHAFQGYAEVFWPTYAPLAAWLMEPERLRRRLIFICLLVGMAVSL